MNFLLNILNNLIWYKGLDSVYKAFLWIKFTASFVGFKIFLSTYFLNIFENLIPRAPPWNFSITSLFLFNILLFKYLTKFGRHFFIGPFLLLLFCTISLGLFGVFFLKYNFIDFGLYLILFDCHTCIVFFLRRFEYNLNIIFLGILLNIRAFFFLLNCY